MQPGSRLWKPAQPRTRPKIPFHHSFPIPPRRFQTSTTPKRHTANGKEVDRKFSDPDLSVQPAVQPAAQPAVQQSRYETDCVFAGCVSAVGSHQFRRNSLEACRKKAPQNGTKM